MKRVGGLFLYAILAGFCIGLGGTVFLKLKDAFPGGNVVGALLFTIGLFTVCTRGYALFTGKACYLFDNPLPAYLLDLLVFWVGNLLGAMLIAGLEHLTGMVGGETGIDATAAALVEGKMGATYLGLFVLGILCNICIFIAVNGLDPQGIIEMRELILKLNREYQITVLLSSHILDELARLATHYGFLDQGTLVREVSAQELEAACRRCVRLTVTDAKTLCRVLDGRGLEYRLAGEGEADVYEAHDLSQLILDLHQAGCQVTGLHQRDETLESYYMNLVGGGRDV